MAEFVYCECGADETPENPKRECSECSGFIEFANEVEWEDWVNSMASQEREFRCITCWNGESRCTCAGGSTLMCDVEVGN